MAFDFTVADDLGNPVRVQSSEYMPVVWVDVQTETGVLKLTVEQARYLAAVIEAAAREAAAREAVEGWLARFCMVERCLLYSIEHSIKHNPCRCDAVPPPPP